MTPRRYSLWAASILAVGLTVWLVVPEVIEWSAGRWLRDRLAQRDVQWRELEWTWTGHAAMRGVEFRDRRVSGRWTVDVAVSADRISVGLPWSILWSEGPASLQLDSVTVAGARAEVSVGQRDDPSASSTTGSSSEKGSLATRLSAYHKRAAAAFPTVRTIDLRDATLHIELGEGRSVTVGGAFRASSPSGVTSGSGEWRIESSASNAGAVSNGRWTLEGERDSGGEWRGTLDGEATTIGQLLGGFEAGFQAVSWRITPAKSPCDTRRYRMALVAPRIDNVLGSHLQATKAGVSLAVPSSRCQESSAAEATLFADAPTVRLRSHEGVGASKAPGSAGAEGRTDSRSTVDPLSDRLAGGARRFAGSLFSMLSLEIEEASLLLPGDESPAIEELTAAWHPERAYLTAALPSGSIDLRAALDAESGFPTALVWDVRQMDLGHLFRTAGRLVERWGSHRRGSAIATMLAGRVDGVVDLSGWLSATGDPLRGLHDWPDDLAVGAVDAAAREVSLDVPGLADDSVGPIRGDIRANLSSRAWPPRVALSTFEGPDMGAHVGTPRAEIPFDISVTVARAAPADVSRSLRLRVQLPKTSCAEAFSAVPDALWGAYRDATLSGEAAPELEMSYRLGRPTSFALDLDGWPGSCRVSALNARRSAWPPVQIRTGSGTYAEPGEEMLRGVDWLNQPFALRVTEGVSDDTTILVGPGTNGYAELAGLPKPVSAAAYLSEEVAFWRDGVLNLHLIERAVRMNLEERRFVYGGSTITQQLVKNLFLSRDKTLARKLREALIGWRLLDVVSKERVLELYLNCIEFGPDIYGIERAARHYFQRPATDLTLKQAVFLAIIKPAPWYGERFRRRGTTPTKHWWRERMGEIIARLVIHDVITREEALAARPFVLRWNDEGEWVATPHSESDEPKFRSTLKQADAEANGAESSESRPGQSNGEQ